MPDPDECMKNKGLSLTTRCIGLISSYPPHDQGITSAITILVITNIAEFRPKSAQFRAFTPRPQRVSTRLP